MRRTGVIGILATLAALLGAPTAILGAASLTVDSAGVTARTAHESGRMDASGGAASELVTIVVAVGLTSIGGVAMVSLAMLIAGWRRGRQEREGRRGARPTQRRLARPGRLELPDDPIVSAMRLHDRELPRASDFPMRPSAGDPAAPPRSDAG